MTQPPYPYQPPPGAPPYYGPFGSQPPPRDPLGPAKRASVLLFVLGGLAVVGGLCIGAIIWIVPLDQIIGQVRESLSPQQLSQLPEGITLEQIVRIGYTVLGALGVAFGVVLLCLAPFVRRGGRGSTITGIVLFVLIGLWCVLNLLSVLMQFARGPSPTAIGALLVVALLGATVIVALIFLFQAVRVTGHAAWYRQQQMHAAYWQYQQQAANPQAAGYGYGSAPPAGIPQPPAQQQPAPPSDSSPPPQAPQ